MKIELAEQLARRDITCSDEQVELLARYAEMLWQMNESLNLTRHTDLESFVGRDIVDTLQLAKFIEPEERVLDVGSGGGVPGIPLAILRPELKVDLCESVVKKAKVLEQFVADLGLPLVVKNGRAETIVTKQKRYNVLTMRAVGPIWKIGLWFRAVWIRFDRVLVLKGPKWLEEIQEAKERKTLGKTTVSCLAKYDLQGADGKAAVIEMRRSYGSSEDGDQ